MIGYLDSSALVKRYVEEPGSDLVRLFLEQAESAATVGLTRVEVTAAFAKAVRVGALKAEEAEACRRLADRDWPHLVRLPATDPVIGRAAELAWGENLRGYAALQLAAGCAWQEALDQPVSFATFDTHLWTAAGRHRLSAFPPDLPSLVEGWRRG